MVFYRYSGGKNRQTVLNEIERCCSLEIVQAVNRPKEDSTGIPGFRDLVRKKDTGGIYELLKAQSKKGRIKNIVRKIAAKL